MKTGSIIVSDRDLCRARNTLGITREAAALLVWLCLNKLGRWACGPSRRLEAGIITVFIPIYPMLMLLTDQDHLGRI